MQGDRSRALGSFFILIPLCLLAFVFALGMGAVALSPLDVLKGIWGLITKAEESIEQIIVNLRLVRALMAAIVGAALAASGAALQGLFRNPLADPYVIGSSSGAALGAVIVITMGGTGLFASFTSIGLGAFIGGISTTLLVYLIAGSSRMKNDATSLLLAGTAISSLVSAVVSILLALKDKSLGQVWFWIMGGFSGRGMSHLLNLLPGIIIGFIAILASARVLDMLSAGDEEARSMGLNAVKARFVVGGFTALLVSSTVALAGAIGFVGLVSPHIARKLTGPKHSLLVPASALTGAAMLLFSDTLSRVLFAPMELPTGAITALIGAPFFLYRIALKGLEQGR